MCVPVGSVVAADDIVLWVDAIRLRPRCTWNVDRDVHSVSQHKAVLNSVREVVEADDMPIGIDTCYPREDGLREVDCGELACPQQKAMKQTVSAKVSANYTP